MDQIKKNWNCASCRMFSQFMEGGSLELILDELPNKVWGAEAIIPEIKK